MSELQKRILSGLVVGSLVLLLTYWHLISFALLILVGGEILWREWRNLTRARGRLWALGGAFYIISAVTALLFMRTLGTTPIFQLFALVWAGDSAAYFIGKTLGRHKIIPRISPGKSWEGLAASALASSLVAFFTLAPTIGPAIAIGTAIAVIGLCGDLFESALKRNAGVKDSGRLIPGHGGLFDRVDALLPCAIFLAVLLYMEGMMG